MTEPAKRLVATLEMIPLARFVPSSRGWVGRPAKGRLAIASAFVAKGRVRVQSHQTVAGRSRQRYTMAADLRLETCLAGAA